KLAESYAKAGNVLLPMLFRIEQPLGRPDKPLPAYVLKNAVAAAGGAEPPLPTSSVQVPIEALGGAAKGLGHLNATPDVDGGIRQAPLALPYFDQYYPSLSMMIAAASLNLGPADIKLRLGEGVSLGRLQIGT